MKLEQTFEVIRGIKSDAEHSFLLACERQMDVGLKMVPKLVLDTPELRVRLMTWLRRYL